jgi:hypothetical protein
VHPKTREAPEHIKVGIPVDPEIKFAPLSETSSQLGDRDILVAESGSDSSSSESWRAERVRAIIVAQSSEDCKRVSPFSRSSECVTQEAARLRFERIELHQVLSRLDDSLPVVETALGASCYQ